MSARRLNCTRSIKAATCPVATSTISSSRLDWRPCGSRVQAPLSRFHATSNASWSKDEVAGLYLFVGQASRSCRRPNSADSSVGGQKLSPGTADLIALTHSEIACRFIDDFCLSCTCLTGLLTATCTPPRREKPLQINQLPPAERQATLVREAKNERSSSGMRR